MPWHGVWGPWGGLLTLTVLGLLVWLIVRGFRKRPPAGPGAFVCPSCGGGVEPVFFRCPRCGHPLKTHCPACSRVVDADWTFCPYCGHRAAGQASSGQPSPPEEGGTQ